MKIRVTLDEVLRQKNMSPADLVEVAKITMPTVHALLLNTSKRIEFETLAKLCAALDCEPGDLLKRQD